MLLAGEQLASGAITFAEWDAKVKALTKEQEDLENERRA